MSFIRPEITQTAAKYREPLIGGALAALGLYVLLTTGGILSILGAVLIVIALPTILLSLRCIALQSDHIGLGVVQVTEREIQYQTPYQDGGVLSVEDLHAVTVRNAQGPRADLYWFFEDRAGMTLTIPNSATGAEHLPGALAALDGVDLEAASRARTSGTDETIMIWTRPVKRLD